MSEENSSNSIQRVRPANSHWRGVRDGAAGCRLGKDSGGGGEGDREMVRTGNGRLAIAEVVQRLGAAAVDVVDSLSSSE